MQNYKTRRWWQRESERPWAWQWDQSIQFGSGLGLDRISKAWPMKERIDKLDAMVWMCPPPQIHKPKSHPQRDVHMRSYKGSRRRQATPPDAGEEVARCPGEPGASITGERVPGTVPRWTRTVWSCFLPTSPARGTWPMGVCRFLDYGIVVQHSALALSVFFKKAHWKRAQ